MSQHPTARPSRRSPLVAVVVGLVLAAAAWGGAVEPGPGSTSTPASRVVARLEQVKAKATSRPIAAPAGLPREGGSGASADDDGDLPDGVTVFDDQHAGVTQLDPDLLQALRSAADEAADDGIVLYVNSGWRSPEHQERLLQDAVAKYGSLEAASRWVATPSTSPHVSGDAADIGRPTAASWLGDHGARYGLCQIYDNEPWHVELRPDAVDHGCPTPYADPTHDPRMH